MIDKGRNREPSSAETEVSGENVVREISSSDRCDQCTKQIVDKILRIVAQWTLRDTHLLRILRTSHFNCICQNGAKDLRFQM